MEHQNPIGYLNWMLMYYYKQDLSHLEDSQWVHALHCLQDFRERENSKAT